MRTSVLILGAALLGSPVAAQTNAPAAAPTTAPAAPVAVTAGTMVSDTGGAQVGTVTAVANGNATVDTGTVKVAIPVASFAKGQTGLILAMTKAQVEAAAAAAKPTDIAVGTAVVGPKGNPVGTVTAVNGDLITLQMPNTKVQLPKTAFAQNVSGTLVIGMTQEQLEAAAAKATQPPG